MALIDTGLIVRYYCDEAASGDGPTEVLDGSGVGVDFDLAIDYSVGDAAYDEVSGNRGLSFLTINGGAKATKLIDNSTDKIRDNLHGSKTGTLEIVSRLDNGNDSVGRFVIITTNAGEGSFGILADASDPPDNGYIRVNDSDTVWFDMAVDERAVWHLVFDSNLGTSEDRVRVYKNGSLVVDSDGTIPNQDATVDIGTNSYLCLGNRPNGNRETDGIVFYAAIYDIAFTQAQCEANYDVLILDDDTPSVAVGHDYLAAMIRRRSFDQLRRM